MKRDEEMEEDFAAICDCNELDVESARPVRRVYCYAQCADPWFNECADCWQSGGNPPLGKKPA